MLKRLYADNFRALVNFEFKPGRLNLLLGDNGSGKTSVFDVLGRIKDLIVLGVPAAEIFSFSTTRWTGRDLQRFELEIELPSGSYRYILEVHHPPRNPGGALVHSETVLFEGQRVFHYSDGTIELEQEGSPAPAVFPFRADRSFLTNIDSQGSRKTPRLVELKRFIEGLWVLQPNPFQMDTFTRHETPFLGRYCANFASFFSYLNSERPELRNQLETHLKEALPNFKNFSLPRAGDQKLLKAHFESQGQRLDYTFLELSEGQRVLAVLYSAVLGLARSGAPLCFDEPDNFVSLGEIQPWLHLLRDESRERGDQVMVISHHPEVMDYLALDSVWVFERPAGHVRVRAYSSEPTPETETLRLSELVARGM